MAKKRKFGRGGMTIDTPSTADVLSGVTAERRDSPDVSVEPKLSKSAARQDMSFGQAFRDARNSGASTFMWRGRSYGTQLAGERSSAPSRRAASSPSPAPAPSRRAASSPSPAPAPSRRSGTFGTAGARSALASQIAGALAARRAAASAATPAGASARFTTRSNGAPPRLASTPARPALAPSTYTSRTRMPADNERSTAAERARVRNNRSGVFGYKKGGSVSSRGDGIAKRGKTKGKIR